MSHQLHLIEREKKLYFEIQDYKQRELQKKKEARLFYNQKLNELSDLHSSNKIDEESYKACLYCIQSEYRVKLTTIRSFKCSRKHLEDSLKESLLKRFDDAYKELLISRKPVLTRKSWHSIFDVFLYS